MSAIYMVVVVVFVVGVLAAAAYVLFQLSPFARHADTFRDPATGQWLGESPRLG